MTSTIAPPATGHWFDTHAHLHDERFDDLDDTLARACAAGVARVICCGTEEADWPRVAEIAAGHSDLILPAFGLHPWYVGRRSPDWAARLIERLDAHPTAPVGEIGLDGAIEPRDAATQEEVFLFQLRRARDRARPASIHGRRAWGRLAEILRAAGPFVPGVVLHSYSGAPELVPIFAACGAYFSFSGAVTWSRNLRARRALAAVPPDRLLLESDAPDLPAERVVPTSAEAQARSEPAHLPWIAQAVAEARGWSLAEVAERTFENACRIFGAIAQ